MLTCPYCSKPAKRATGRTVYPHRPDLTSKRFWVCTPCDAFVGCQPEADVPMGRLANAPLRARKIQVHNALDPLWKGPDKWMSRTEAYRRLAQLLEMTASECHVGLFDEQQCIQALVAISIIKDTSP